MHFSKSRKILYDILTWAVPFNLNFVNKIKFYLLSPMHKRYVQLSPTYDCQCDCVHCGMSKYENTGQKLNTNEVLKIIDDLVSWGFGQIDFFGGEPMLEKEIYSYIRHAYTKGIFTHINTNGLLLNDKNVDKLSKSGLSAISISFDSLDENKHDKNRGINGAFSKAMEGAEKCISKRIRTIMSIYATEDELKNGNTKKLIDLAKKKGFYRVRLLTSFKTGKLSDKKITQNDELPEGLSQILSDKVFVKPHGISKCFIYHKSTVYISPFGDVQPCSMIPITFGNIRNEPFEGILKRLRSHPMTNIETQGCIMNSEYMKKNFHDKIDINSEKLPVPVSRLVFFQEKG